VGAAIWESALAEPGTVHEWAIDTLPSPLRSVAAAQGYQWVSLYAVPDSDGGPPPAALVVWSSHDFAMHVFTHERVQRCGSLVALVTQWERGQRALRWEATHDVLTGLHNRSFFLNELASIAPFEPPSALLYLDLDDFKPVNDEHGHRVGDNVLVEVATRLRRSVRPSDIVARLGGDEFAVLCRDLDDAAAAEVLCARLVDAVGQPLAVDGVEVQVGLSVGLALLEADEDPERALNRADMALRRAKVDGKRRWRRASDVAALASTV
jgi:diguanylate cyclase (GGDEF)-like protein